MTTHSARARSFDAVAASYAANRPSYPPALLDAIEELSGRRWLKGLDILEIGAGAAQCSRWLAAQDARPVALDLSHRQLQHALRIGEGVPLVEADAGRLPFRDASFDLACSAYGAVPFVADPVRVFREVHRVLRPGGALALWWNDADPRVGWIGDQKRRVLEAFGTETGEGDEGVAAYDPDARLRAELPAGPDFRTRQVEWAREVPLGVHLANLASHSVFLVADRAVATAVLERERALLADVFPGGRVREAYVTSLGIART
ncbi:class I SAM-dependent methyltransferase [Streptomyces sp. S6]|nr:class I SAM-dependent methyltransferase [Streptomyces sp. S6]